MLYIVATPIGNLKDITIRAVETLKSVDLILCEDTRTSGVLMKEYGIATKLKSFHKFSEKSMEDAVVAELKRGKEIALISDAGTPGISDPGESLVRRCLTEGLNVTSLPGASAPIVALTLSGFSLERFQFLGFLPKKLQERKRRLIEAFYYPGVTLFFESPNRVQTTLEEVAKLAPNQEVAVVREITKKYEEVLKGKASELVGKEIRGEVVLAFEGFKEPHFEISIKEHVNELQEKFDLNKPDAMKLVSHFRGISKKDVYSCLITGEEL